MTEVYCLSNKNLKTNCTALSYGYERPSQILIFGAEWYRQVVMN